MDALKKILKSVLILVGSLALLIGACIYLVFSEPEHQGRGSNWSQSAADLGLKALFLAVGLTVVFGLVKLARGAFRRE